MPTQTQIEQDLLFLKKRSMSSENDVADLAEEVDKLDLKISTTANTLRNYTDTAVNAAVAKVYRVMGNVPDLQHLPDDPQIGDVYNIGNTGYNVVWTGTEWDKLSETVDLAPYSTTEQMNSAIGSAISTEVSNRNSAISSAISTEVSNRNTAIKNAVDKEVSDRNSAIASSVSSEANARAQADTAEAQARSQADTNLQEQINGKQPLINRDTFRAVSGPAIGSVGTPDVDIDHHNGVTDLVFNYLKGEQGDKGPAPTVKFSRGTDFDETGYGDITVRSPAPFSGEDYEVTFHKMKGPQGEKGNTGQKGDKGDKGDPPSLSIVQGTDFGQTGTPSVEVDQYTFSDYKITFHQMKGAKGDKGDTGAQGPQGIQGIQGIQGPQGPQGPGWVLKHSEEVSWFNGSTYNMSTGFQNAVASGTNILCLGFTDPTNMMIYQFVPFRWDVYLCVMNTDLNRWNNNDIPYHFLHRFRFRQSDKKVILVSKHALQTSSGNTNWAADGYVRVTHLMVYGTTN